MRIKVSDDRIQVIETERESLDSNCWPGVSRNALELAAITILWFDARAGSTPLRREKPELHLQFKRRLHTAAKTTARYFNTVVRRSLWQTSNG